MFAEHIVPAPRRQVRTPFPVEVLRTGSGARFLGYAANVSETGLFVQCSNPRAVGTHLNIQLHLPARTEGGCKIVVNGEASVVWTRGHGKSGAPGMGIRFSTIGVADLISLREFSGAYRDPGRVPSSLQMMPSMTSSAPAPIDIRRQSRKARATGDSHM